MIVGLLVSTAGTCFGQEAEWTLRFRCGPAPRFSPAMTYDSARGATVLFSGCRTFGGGGEFRDTWEWSGNTWTQRAAGGPPARWYSAMAYDSTRNVCVLYGGLPGSWEDTWEWDGTTWQERTVPGPSPRFGHAMAYDSRRAVVVLFGGNIDAFENRGLTNETWEWDGSTWTLRTNGGPSPRAHHAMAFDADRGECVVFGGDAGNGLWSSETWTWDGAAWTLRSDEGPSGRRTHAMAYDAVRRVAVLYGGEDHRPGALADDTWEWDGAAWALRSVGVPSARSGVGLAFDPLRGRTVLFGGLGALDLGETWEYGPPVVFCPIDFNHDDFVDFFDYDAFVVAYEGGSPLADFNGDCFVDFFDYDGFVEAYERGC